MKKERVVYLDYLRVLATISVVVLHVAAQNFTTPPARNFMWQSMNFYDGIVRWGVPVFVMISGSLFLHRNIEVKSLYLKNILKMFVVYALWSIFYAFAPILWDFALSGTCEAGDLSAIIAKIIGGNYHMWFIPMIIGIYMCIPVIKQISKDKKVTKYFLCLSFVFAFLFPQLVMLCNDFPVGFLPNVMNKLNDSFVSNMNMKLVLGYGFYFILGYFLSNIDFNNVQRKIIYVLGAIGFLLTVLLNGIVAWKTNVPCSKYYGNFSVNVLFEATAVFVFFKYLKYNNSRINLIVAKLSKYSFGAYLIHVFVIDSLGKFGIHNLIYYPIITIPAISAVVVIISFAISIVLNKIPKINKWIV